MHGERLKGPGQSKIKKRRWKPTWRGIENLSAKIAADVMFSDDNGRVPRQYLPYKFSYLIARHSSKFPKSKKFPTTRPFGNFVDASNTEELLLLGTSKQRKLTLQRRH
jgi:hypothetical protein